MMDEINYCTSCGRALTAFSACRIFSVKHLFSSTVQYQQACPYRECVSVIRIYDGESVTVE